MKIARSRHEPGERHRLASLPLATREVPIRRRAVHWLERQNANLPRVWLTPAALSAAKWFALALMLLDHVNKYLLDGTSAWMYAAGRLSMPLFAVVLGANLAQPAGTAGSMHRRLAARMLLFGCLATPAFLALNRLAGGWWPLNMMFTLLVAVLVCWMREQSGRLCRIAAWPVLLWGGALVEFWWPAIGICLCSRAYLRTPSVACALGFLLSLLALWFVNGNFWALACLPVLWALQHWWACLLPRAQWFFYAFYPAHLTVLWLLQLR